MIEMSDLLECLRLAPVNGGGGWVGPNLALGPRVFGGQVLGQAIVAAAREAPGKDVKSIHALFPREGQAGQPLPLATERHHDGRAFATVAVTAAQEGRTVAVATVSLHDGGEEGPGRQSAAPAAAAGTPDDGTPVDLGVVPWEVRFLDGADLDDRGVGPATLAMWMRSPALPDDATLHRALLAHATDLTLIGTALRPFPGLSQLDAHSTVPTAVTSHTVWFHRPFRLDDWLLLVQESPVAAHGRAFGRGDVHTADGTLVASYAQESLVRVPRAD